MPNELDILRQASAGLLYPSESDEPFEPVRFNKIEEITKGRTYKNQSVEEFFKELLQSDDADRYRALRETIDRILKNPQVLRVGSPRVDVYLIGQTPTGHFVGLHTISVET